MCKETKGLTPEIDHNTFTESIYSYQHYSKSLELCSFMKLYVLHDLADTKYP